MKMPDAVLALRRSMGDTGIFLASFGGTSGVAGSPTIPVDRLENILPVGQYIIVGTGANQEGYTIVGVSALNGAGQATIDPPLVSNWPTNTAIRTVLMDDYDYEDAIKKAIYHYSTLRPLVKQTTLSLVAGQSEYNLPADFIEPDRKSFDEALGMKSDLSVQSSFYSLIYQLSERFSAVGFGSTVNFGISSWYNYAPLVGDPMDNPNSGLPSVQNLKFTFITSAEPKLIVSPAPGADLEIQFFYDASHVLPTSSVDTTVPVMDEYAIILYARYLLSSTMASVRAQVTEQHLNDFKLSYLKSASEYEKQAQSAKAEFDCKIRFVAGGSMG